MRKNHGPKMGPEIVYDLCDMIAPKMTWNNLNIYLII